LASKKPTSNTDRYTVEEREKGLRFNAGFQVELWR